MISCKTRSGFSPEGLLSDLVDVTMRRLGAPMPDNVRAVNSCFLRSTQV
jgi:hypothetical protein